MKRMTGQEMGELLFFMLTGFLKLYKDKGWEIPTKINNSITKYYVECLEKHGREFNSE